MALFFAKAVSTNNGIPKGVYSLWSGQGLTALAGFGAAPRIRQALRKG